MKEDAKDRLIRRAERVFTSERIHGSRFSQWVLFWRFAASEVDRERRRAKAAAKKQERK